MNSTKQHTLVKVSVFTIVLALLIIFLQSLMLSPRASAKLNPNTVYPGAYYTPINNYNRDCPFSPNKYAHYIWVSPANVPTNNTTLPVSYGQMSANLWYNYHMFLCRDIVNQNGATYFLLPRDGYPSGASMVESRTYITSARVIQGSATIGTSPAGQISRIPKQTNLAGTGYRYWDADPVGFSVVSTSSGGFTTNQTIVIEVLGASANLYNNGTWYCVGNGQPSFLNLPNGCASGPSNFQLTLSVAPPPPLIECSGTNTIPEIPEPNEPFSATAGFTLNNGNPNQSYSYTIRDQATGTIIGSGTLQTDSSGDGAGSATYNHPGLSAGSYSGSYIVSVTGVSATKSCAGQLIVSSKPYLRVYSGDVLAGSGFGSSCTPNSDAHIITFNKGSGVGAGTQLVAQSSGSITEFGSAIGRTIAPIPDSGLTFANTGGGFGGSFGDGGICAKDYFAGATNPSGNTTINATSVADGQHIVRYVDGNAVIAGNITFAGSGTWNSLSQIPSYYLIVRGNIYISRDVTRLDGVFIAQPNTSSPSTTGRIYTCRRPTGGAVSATELYDRCINKLTINGAFVAQQVKFLRSTGTLRNSSNTEASSSSNIAEVFVYSPELWLINPGLTPLDLNPYDSITSLPPVL